MKSQLIAAGFTLFILIIFESVSRLLGDFLEGDQHGSLLVLTILCLFWLIYQSNLKVVLKVLKKIDKPSKKS